MSIFSALLKGLAGGNTKSKPAKTQSLTITPKHHWPTFKGHSFECEVTGESHHQKHLKSMAGKHGKDSANREVLALLLPEPKNPYDKNAVRIFIEELQVGYLPKDHAKLFLERLEAINLPRVAPTTCNAKIMGGFTKENGEKASYGVLLDIEPFDD